MEFEPIFEGPGPLGEVHVDPNPAPGYYVYNLTNDHVPVDETSSTRFNLTIHMHDNAAPLGDFEIPVDSYYQEAPGGEDELTVFIFDEVTGKTKGKKKYHSAVHFAGG